MVVKNNQLVIEWVKRRYSCVCIYMYIQYNMYIYSNIYIYILLLLFSRSVVSDQLFCDPMDCSPPGSSVHGIFQARILERVAIPYPRVSSWPRHWTQVSCIAGGFFTTEPPTKPLSVLKYFKKLKYVFIWRQLISRWRKQMKWKMMKSKCFPDFHLRFFSLFFAESHLLITVTFTANLKIKLNV